MGKLRHCSAMHTWVCGGTNHNPTHSSALRLQGPCFVFRVTCFFMIEVICCHWGSRGNVQLWWAKQNVYHRAPNCSTLPPWCALPGWCQQALPVVISVLSTDVPFVTPLSPASGRVTVPHPSLDEWLPS